MAKISKEMKKEIWETTGEILIVTIPVAIEVLLKRKRLKK